MMLTDKASLRSLLFVALVALCFIGIACSARGHRGIADKRTNFQSFIPMDQDPSRDGLRAVKPYFKKANRAEILRAIERACQGRKAGSSVYEPATDEGYYVNCNPRNRQLLNGYAPANPRREPHSRP